jgi:hypothetical protein
MTREEATMKLAAYVPMLLDRFPDAAFTPASLQHVAARAVKGFPTYGELVEWLREWWMPNRPPLAALAPPDIPPPRPEPTDEERAAIAVRVAEAVAHLTAREPVEPPTRFGVRPLSPGQLDAINPLPNGRKRAAPPDATR